MKLNMRSAAGKRTALIVLLVLVLLLASTPFAMAAEPGEALSSGLGRVWEKAQDWFENGYEKSPKTFDFLGFFFLIFTAIFIGAKTAFQGRENIGNAMIGLALVVAAIGAIALVFGAGYSIVQLKYVFIGVLFFIITTVFYMLFMKIGMENHKVLAFFLAAIITAVLMFFGAALIGDGTPDFGFGRSDSSSSSSSGTSSTSSSKTAGQWWNPSTWFGGKDKAKWCISTDLPDKVGVNAFEQGKSTLKPGLDGAIITYVKDKCISGGKIVIDGYASAEGKERTNKELAAERALTVKTVLVKEGLEADSRGRGVTWKFSGSVDERQKRIIRNALADNPEYETLLAPNRAFEISCECVDGKYSEKEANPELDSEYGACVQSTRFNMKDIFKKVKNLGGKYLSKDAESEILAQKKLLEQCWEEYSEKDESEHDYIEYKDRYYTALYEYYSSLGEGWFTDMGDYGKAKLYFSNLVKADVPESQKEQALKKWYSMVDKHYDTMYDKYIKPMKLEDSETIDVMEKYNAALDEAISKSKKMELCDVESVWAVTGTEEEEKDD